MSSVNLSGVSAVIRARSLALLIHEGLENSIVLGLLCQVGMQYERVISLSRGTVHRKGGAGFFCFKTLRGHSLAFLFLSFFLCLPSYASDLRHLLRCCFC